MNGPDRGAGVGPATMAEVLSARAADAPDRCFVEVDGEELTYRQAHDRVAAVAAGLLARGLEPGDRLAILAPNSIDSILLWLGANAAGIVDVPINVHARGASLRQLIADAAPAALAADPAMHERLVASGAALPGLRIVLAGEGGAVPPGDAIAAAELSAEAATTGALPALRRREDLATILYSSGTTGPSKGVMLPQGHYPGWGTVLAGLYDLEPGRRLYCAQPLYHVDCRGALTAAAIKAAAVTLASRFSASGFWDDVRRAGAERFLYVGTMLWLLFKQEPSSQDGFHGATLGVGSSTPEEIQAEFQRRFGVELLETYGMTEGFVLSANTREASRRGSVGRPTEQVELRILDEEDRPLPPGEVGEIAFRPCHPGLVSLGYWRKPEETVRAWRNLWFHTGDLGRFDADGFLYYVGRRKDSIRRRGENVSAWEVEQAITAHPGVAEAAAFGVPSPLGEEDVAALVVAGAEAPDPAQLHAFVAAELPAFAVPRFIEFVDALPKTPSERVDKGAVRSRGLGPAPWEAETR